MKQTQFILRLYGYPLFEELHIGALSLNQVTTIDIKQSVFNGISKKENRGDSQSNFEGKKLVSDFSTRFESPFEAAGRRSKEENLCE